METLPSIQVVPPSSICFPLPSHCKPLREIQHCPTPWPTDNLALKRPTEQAKQEEHHKRNPQYNSKRPPIILDFEFDARELDAEIPGHQRHGHEHDCYFGEKKGD